MAHYVQIDVKTYFRQVVGKAHEIIKLLGKNNGQISGLTFITNSMKYNSKALTVHHLNTLEREKIIIREKKAGHKTNYVLTPKGWRLYYAL